ncbi:MAG: 2-amino-4-hydroxy-6-hydroxymethyldihydropteridine diphosphokinase [Bryobacteraceae bacterium]|nr:MAG: 2-amino-4-hydroxy-6-hydroxymethyldihydropteridine diphosphokinase [Bryobacteraceae bacterium]
MVEAWIALGSNLGNRRSHLRGALREVLRLGRLRAVSPLYETEPVGLRGQPEFLNAVARLDTALGARPLLDALLDIEIRHGRVRGARYGPRTLDLDLLFYGEAVIREPGLEVPHPRLHERRFVLEPLAAAAPELRHPLLGRTVRELLENLTGCEAVRLAEGPEWAADLVNP